MNKYAPIPEAKRVKIINQFLKDPDSTQAQIAKQYQTTAATVSNVITQYLRSCKQK